MLRRVGIGWVRERLSWGEVQPKQGTPAWGKYQSVADTLAKHQVRAYQIFHDSPGWTRPSGAERCPDDLRDVYRFTTEGASHFAGSILAWEPWNEPDISFFPETSDRYAGIQKAAYLGLKAGLRDARVLTCSFCRGRSEFSDGTFASGAADYAEVFNFHTYAPISTYEATIASWVELAERYGMGDRPIWLTEAGVRLPQTDGELTREGEREQAEFVAKSFATSLAYGVDKHFFFVLPHYVEGPIQFGALRKDLSPRPAAVAIATAARLLGQSDYLGRLDLGADSARAFVFRNEKELLAVMWSAEPSGVTVGPVLREARVLDHIGRELPVRASDGSLSMQVASEPRYVTGLAEEIVPLLRGPVRGRGVAPRLDPSHIVLAGRFEGQRWDKDRDHWIVGTSSEVPFAVDVYNLDEREPARGTVTVEAPDGWTVAPESTDADLAAFDRRTVRFSLTRRSGSVAAVRKVRVTGDFGVVDPAPSVSSFALDVAGAEPARRRSLELNAPDRWVANISGNGKMRLEAIPGGGVVSRIEFTAPGDRWCYPAVRYTEPQDWREWDGIAFEYRFEGGGAETNARLQVVEESGASYISGVLAHVGEWRRVVCLFGQLEWGSFSTADPDHRLDLDQVRTLMVGCNTPDDRLSLHVRNLELVSFGD
jgi:hypothetical protein